MRARLQGERAHRLRAPPTGASRRRERWLPVPLGTILLLASLAVGLVAAGPVAARDNARREAPRLEWRGDRLVVSRLPDPTTDETALEHLESGLTTTLVVRASVRGAGGENRRAEGYLAVRWDLWDEVFEVATRGLVGSGRRQLAGRRALARWWRDLTFELPSAAGSRPQGVRLEIELLPFSRAEQEDARRWVSDALRQEGEGADRAAQGAAADGPEPLANVLNLLMATSVRRDPVARWRWRLAVPAPPGTSGEVEP